jgi:hypothetical protein
VPGARRIQLVQTTPVSLRVRVEAEPGVEVERTRADAVAKVRAYLVEQGLGGVDVVGATEPPEPSARSGKFRAIVPL